MDDQRSVNPLSMLLDVEEEGNKCSTPASLTGLLVSNRGRGSSIVGKKRIACVVLTSECGRSCVLIIALVAADIGNRGLGCSTSLVGTRE